MDFKLPDIGEGVAEGEITKWLVKAGDSVDADQPIVEIMTDKATVEIPSPMAGKIAAVMAKEGETVPVGTVIVRIEGANGAEKGAKKEAAPSHKEALKEEKKEAKPAPKQTKAVEEDEAEEVETAPEQEEKQTGQSVVPFKVLATPATRKLARDLKIDLGGIKGTGPHGRVTKMDVQMAYEGQQAATPRGSHPVPSGRDVSRTVLSPTQYVGAGAIEKVPFKGIRKKIAQAMSLSKHTAAHFTYVEEVDMSEIVKMRASAKEEAASRDVKLTFLPFVIKALIPALKEFPYLNSTLDEANEVILLKGFYNIGIATDTPNGLMVPVIKDVDRKNIWELASEIHTISERARTGKSTLEDLKGGSFTITNAGSIGGVFATPVINYPEVAILGVNAIRKRPVVKNDQIAIADMMFLSLSVDHRVVDGADAARFMNRLVYFLGDPKRFVFA